VSTVDKALEVLGLFSEVRPSIGLSEVARLLQWDKSTVQRYLAALETQGFLERDALSRAYHLGPAVTRLSVVREITYPIEMAVKNVMAKLVQDTRETVHLSHAQGAGLSSVAIVETTVRNTRVYIDPSEILPLHLTASGTAYLSQEPEEKAQKLLHRSFQKFPSSDAVTVESASTLIRLAAVKGYSVADATFDYDVVGMAAPVFASSGAPCGAVAVATPKSRFDAETQERIATFLVPAAHKISRIHGAPQMAHQNAAE
jgi:DNA-binding IclR family transcriptional regulator